jgi:hypothetical protein
MISFPVAIPKPNANLLITETEILIQPYPVSLLPDFTAGQTRAVLAQANKIFAPNNTYQSQDTVGRVGKYQFNAQTLELLGYLKSGTQDSLRNQNGANALAINAGSNWTGLNQINNVTDWKNSAGVQEQAVVNLYQLNLTQMKKINQTVSALSSDQIAGMLLVAHVAGVTEALRLLNYNLGKTASADASLSQLNQYFYAGSSAYSFGSLVEKA